MISKNFRISIFIRVAVIVTLASVFAFVMMEKQMFFVPVTIIFLIILAVVDLIRYIEKSNKDLTHFLLSIRQGAFTESYTAGSRGKPFEELSDALNEIVREFAKVSAEKELHYQYLQVLNENIGVAIVSFDAEGNLLMINPAARELLRPASLTRLEDFREIDTGLCDTIDRITPGERVTIKAFIEEEQYQLSIQVKEVVLQARPVRIILLQNLNSELEEKEIEAWHQLMGVLTHEIMNSVTPIVSLTAAVQNILTDEHGRPRDLTRLPAENTEDIFSSLSTITSRSKGLLKFASAYKAYARGPELHSETADIIALVTRISDLLSPDFQKYCIHYEVKFQNRPIKAKADIALMEQVLINVVKNAIEAVPHDGSGAIEINARLKTNNAVSISIADNGPGMDKETVHRIFVPFFTTKAGGSGIGLSLSRQIMKQHNGNIRVHSAPGQGSVFTIEWR